ncbi:hypothetical protein [Actinosynnema sp. NPDC020468]|uniref:hypothetical protein n=1 Tax=Actinosynnema sp. NPDC020468 TaxID=3154488 RepID=UPI0033F5F4CE
MTEEAPADLIDPAPDEEPASTLVDDAPESRDEMLALIGSDRHGRAYDQAMQASVVVRKVLGSHVFAAHNVAIYGDFVNGQGSARTARKRQARARPIEQAEIDAVALYVRPEDFDNGVMMLRDVNVVVVADPGKTGRRARAVAMLTEVLGEEARAGLVELPTSALGTRPWQPPGTARGLLVHDEPFQGKYAAHRLDDAWLAQASYALGEQERFLVVVTGVPEGVLAGTAGRQAHVLEGLALPDPLEIVRRAVLAEYPGLTAERYEALITPTTLRDLVAERNDPLFANRAASAVIASLKAGSDLRSDLARLRNPQEQAREWLGADPELSEIALVVTTAVLDESTYLRISEAALSLSKSLGGSSRTNLRFWRMLEAERKWIERDTSADGRGTLRFRHEDLRQAVLVQTWLRLDGGRSAVVRWLTRLASHADVDVHAKATDAAALLTAVDFDFGVHHILVPWAGSSSLTLRQNAALAANAAGVLSGRTDAFWDRLVRWADEPDSTARSRHLAETAALAAGGSLGAAEPGRALAILRTVVRGPQWATLSAVSIGARTLLDAGVTAPLLRALAEWSEGSSEEPSVAKALTVFTYVVRRVVGPGSLPVLLREYERHDDLLIELWGRALACAPARELAEGALRGWVDATVREPDAQDAVLDLVAGVSDRGPDDHLAIDALLECWALDPDATAAAELLYRLRYLEEMGA